jgi:hypothetical protein
MDGTRLFFFAFGFACDGILHMLIGENIKNNKRWDSIKLKEHYKSMFNLNLLWEKSYKTELLKNKMLQPTLKEENMFIGRHSWYLFYLKLEYRINSVKYCELP